MVLADRVAQALSRSTAQGWPDHFLLAAQQYTDPAWEPVEQQQIFHQSWQYVGDAAQLELGQVWALTLAGRPVVISRDRAGTLRAFLNVCPHRAALLCEAGIHTQKHLVCPYHAWTYDLAGELVGTPSRQRFPDSFDPADYDLQPVRLETWSGFMFLCFCDDAPPLVEFLGRVPRYLGQHRRAETRHLLTLRRTVACNWKNYHDNTLCDYHVAISHHHTLHPVQGPIKHYVHEFDTYVNLLRTPVTNAWRDSNQRLADLPEGAGTHFFTFGIYPNLHLLGLPDSTIIWLRIDPITAQTCHLTLEIYGIPSISPPVSTLKTDFEAFMAEDIALTESVQQGYASGTYQPGPVNQLEHRIVHQQQLIAQALQLD